MHILFSLILAMLVLSACATSGGESVSLADLPPGDAARGAELFTESLDGAPACSTCHTLDGTSLVGPSFQGLSSAAANRVAGMTAEAYVHDSIVHPAAHIVDGYVNSMYAQYGQHLTPQQIADLTAYLLSL